MKQADIKHTGIVSKTTREQTEVSIAVSTACAGCHANSSCGMSDTESRIITVNNTDNHFNIGDKVNVVGARSTGMKAVLFAYILPFFAVLITLIVSLEAFHLSEPRAGLYSLLVLLPYYLILFLLKGKFEKKYTFRIVPE